MRSSITGSVPFPAVVLAAAIAFVAAPVTTAAGTIARYSERVVLEPDGTARIEVRLAAPAATGRLLSIPCSSPRVDELRAGAGITSCTTRSADGLCHIDLDLGGSRAAGELGVTYVVRRFFKPRVAVRPSRKDAEDSRKAWDDSDGDETVARKESRADAKEDPASPPTPFGGIVASYGFVNTTLHRIERFEASVVLPPGEVVASVLDVVPRPGKDDSREPFALSSRDDGRRCLAVEASDLKTGGRVLVKWRMKSARRPLWPLALFLAMAILYLVFYRDLVVTATEEKKSDG